jgi:hypothetical protein
MATGGLNYQPGMCLNTAITMSTDTAMNLIPNAHPLTLIYGPPIVKWTPPSPTK